MKESKQSIAKSAVLVTFMMLCFKLMGFVKQAYVAYVYGATQATDSYFIAWGFVSGISEAIVKALLVSLVAIYTELRVTYGKNEAMKLINGMFEITIPATAILSFALYLFAPLVSSILAPSYKGADIKQLSVYIKTLSPLLIFGCFELILGAVSDSHKSFYLPRIQSFIYSVSVIVACLLFSGVFGVKALIYAQYFSSFLFVLILLASTKKYHDYFFVKYKDIPKLKVVIKTAIPLFIGNSALQINQIVDKSITSGLGEGATSALSYCHTLEQFVTNIMIVNLGNIMFANFAEFVAQGDINRVKKTLSTAIDILIAVLSGITIITIVDAKDIVKIVYFRGSFTENAVSLTSIALIGYAVSFVAVAVRDLSVKSLYAFKDTKRPMKASIVSIVINIFFSIILSKFFGIFGVSLATSISAIIGMLINAKSLVKYIDGYKFKYHMNTLIMCIPALVALLFVSLGMGRLFNSNSVLKFCCTSFVGLPIYFFILYLSNIKGLRNTFDLILRRIHSIVR